MPSQAPIARRQSFIAGLLDGVERLDGDDPRWKEIAEEMVLVGTRLGQTRRWRQACGWAREAIEEMGPQDWADETGGARWAVLQGAIHMGYAAE